MKSLFLFTALCLSISIQAQTQRDTLAYNLGLALEGAYDDRDPSLFEAVFNDSIFLSHFLLGHMGNKDIEAVNNEFYLANFPQVFFREIAQLLDQDHYYTFINYSVDNYGKYYLRFRLFGEAGLNYHEYYLEFAEDNSYYISDIYIYLSGEYWSESFETIYNQLIGQFLNEDQNSEVPFSIDALREINEIKALTEAGRIEEALERYDNNIPERTKQEKIAMIMELKMIGPQDSVRYRDLMERLYKVSDNLATIHLINIDRYLLAGEFEKTLHTIDSLEYYTDDDFLDYYRGNIHFAAGNYPESELALQKVLKNYPFLIEAYEATLVLLYLQQKHADMLLVYEAAMENLKLPLSDIDEIAKVDYPECHESTTYQDWYKMQEQKE